MTETEENEYEAYLRGEEYYLSAWKNIKEHNHSRFNIYAFFFGIIWLLYRKMYTVVGLLLVIVFIEYLAEEYVFSLLGMAEDTGRLIANGLSIVMALLLGQFANRLYLWEAERTIRRVRALQLPEEEHYAEIYKRGGYTLIPLIGIAAIILGVMIYFMIINN